MTSMNSNQHYRRALGLLSEMGEPLIGGAWPTVGFASAQWHIAMAQALEGVERTADTIAMPPEVGSEARPLWRGRARPATDT